ncbi:ribose-phosphate pyrophosphokinase [Azoarcus sp. KH32C]|uniref:ribose-phosphate diphosphokinase n=1 Tax=Azoarcus sp. KH32C TaxID=748247 RepID=UPI0002386B36|nr:ribose-phosphate pyrophosphokinase [Azoarcus sp. KH32C]BAL23817.1 ribose-phosphate pyrophosphokinase [Azoarcus sp. KH32C]
MPASDICLFALDNAQDFGQRVAQSLGVALSPHEERGFEDGEHKARPLCSVRGKDVFVIQPLHGDRQCSVNDKLVRLLLFLGTLADASAARVTAVLPYLCYARKEQKTQPRDPVSTRYIAAMFEAVGCDRVVALDVHNLAAFQNAFRCQTEHLEANPLFVRHFAPQLGASEVVVVSPDAGGVKRAERFRQGLSAALGREATLAFMEKHRAGGVMRGGAIVGDVEGRSAVIIDDLISTGSTMLHAAQVCRERGALAVHAAATHGVFSAKAETVLADPALAQVVVTNSIPPFRLSPALVQSKLVVLDIAPLVASAIAAINGNGSITALLEP